MQGLEPGRGNAEGPKTISMSEIKNWAPGKLPGELFTRNTNCMYSHPG